MPLHIPSTGSTWSVQSVVLDPTLPELTSSLNQSSEISKYQPLKNEWHVRPTTFTFK